MGWAAQQGSPGGAGAGGGGEGDGAGGAGQRQKSVREVCPDCQERQEGLGEEGGEGLTKVGQGVRAETWRGASGWKNSHRTPSAQALLSPPQSPPGSRW